MKHISSFALPTYKYNVLDSIWVVIAQMFCKLHSSIQHLVKKSFVIEDEPKYTGITCVYCVTVMFVYFEQQLSGYTKIFWLLLKK